MFFPAVMVAYRRLPAVAEADLAAKETQ